MTTKSIYCSKCRDANGHHIAGGKIGSDIFRRVSVVAQNPNGSYRCECACGHTWTSMSQEAAALYSQARH